MGIDEIPTLLPETQVVHKDAFMLGPIHQRIARPKRVASSRNIRQINSYDDPLHPESESNNGLEYNKANKEVTDSSIAETTIPQRPQLRRAHKARSFLLGVIPRLNRALLKNLPVGVQPSKYDPSEVKAGILHIGTGNFALAHLAAFIHDYLETDKSWGIISTSIRSDRLINLLSKQENLYVIVEKSRDVINPIAIASIVGTVFGVTHPEKIIEYIASPEIKLITVTVTNSGYLLDANLKLVMNSEDVQLDLKTRGNPKTVYGYLAAGIERRMLLNHNVPLTVMSFDNLPSNSKTLHNAFIEFLKHYNRDLISYVNNNVDFLVTLVDRITPEPTEAYKLQMQVRINIRTFVLIGTEKYRSLVVEKGRFSVPKWENVGVKVVDDCSSYMQRKFYCLNAAHMIIAMCGCRLGHKYIHEVAAIKEISSLMDLAFEEWLAFLPGDEQELREYVGIVKSRISDPSLNDAVKRVVSRVTSKIPDRIVSGAIKYKNATGKPMKTAAIAIALYLHNSERKNEKGGFFEFVDDTAYKAADAYKYAFSLLRVIDPSSSFPSNAYSTTLLKLATHMDSDGLRQLASDEQFCELFGNALVNIKYKGLRAAICLHLGHQVPAGIALTRNRHIRMKKSLSFMN